jgi:Ca-activated chloride channel family protein
MNLTFQEMISSFTLSRPWMLTSLLLLPMIWLWSIFLRQRAQQAVISFTGAYLLERLAPKPSRRKLPPFLAFFALFITLIAFAGPHINMLNSNKVANVILVIDTSYSMSSKDANPTRLTVAQNAARDFIQNLPSNWRAGLVTFSEVAVLAAAPTADRASVIASIMALRPDRGTATGDGVDLAIDAGRAGRADRVEEALLLGDQLANPSKTIIVLLSDGKETGGKVRIDAATERARKLGITIHTIALGTDKGIILIANGGVEPELIEVPPDRVAMQAVASATGGQYFEASELRGLSEVYRSVTGAIEQEIVDTDLTPLFGLISIFFIILAGLAYLRHPMASR